MEKLLKKQSQLIEQYQMSNEKEQLLIQAIKNLIIKNNYLQLLLELSDNNITEEEFNKELDQHSEKYFIDVKNELNEKTLLIILDIFKQLGNDFYINDITDLFSINTDNINISSTNKKQINQIINNKKEGYWEECYGNGNILSKGNYKEGKVEGYWEFYHDNGKIRSKGNYTNGLRDGYWEYYNYNGKLWNKGNYKDEN